MERHDNYGSSAHRPMRDQKEQRDWRSGNAEGRMHRDEDDTYRSRHGNGDRQRNRYEDEHDSAYAGGGYGRSSDRYSDNRRGEGEHTFADSRTDRDSGGYGTDRQYGSDYYNEVAYGGGRNVGGRSMGGYRQDRGGGSLGSLNDSYGGPRTGGFGGNQGRHGDQYGGQRGSEYFGSEAWGQGGQSRGKGPKGYTRTDDRIKEQVCDCLTDDEHLDASEIEVQVKSGEVTLAGSVSDRASKRHAEDLIERMSGVKHVQNNLRVKEQQSSMGQQDDKKGPGARSITS